MQLEIIIDVPTRRDALLPKAEMISFRESMDHYPKYCGRRGRGRRPYRRGRRHRLRRHCDSPAMWSDLLR